MGHCQILFKVLILDKCSGMCYDGINLTKEFHEQLYLGERVLSHSLHNIFRLSHADMG